MAAQPTTEIEIHSPSACIVTLRGEHDVASSEAITLALTLARGYTNVLVDLGGCAFVDSSVITVLLQAAKRAGEQGGTLELVVPVATTAVRRTLEIANVQGALPFHATRADGIASVSAQPPANGRQGRAVAKTAGPIAARRKPTGGVTVVRARIADDPPLRSTSMTDEERWAA